MSLDLERLYIFGGRSTAIEIREAARELDPALDIVHVIGDQEQAPEKLETVPLSGLEDHYRNQPASCGFILSMANFEVRRKKLEVAGALGIPPTTIIHPKSWVSPSADIGPGCFIAAGAKVSVQAQIGPHSILNLNVTFGHDAICGRHTVINTGAAISGNCQLGDRVWVGANSFIFQGCKVGDDTRIDALTYVARDIDPGMLVTSRTMNVYPRTDQR